MHQAGVEPSVHPPVPNGFTKSTQVHRYSPAMDTKQTLRQQHPYAAR